ncbi:nitrate reductase molybdenum cofactor assembly chaperone [Spirillospora sp. CA-255316]
MDTVVWRAASLLLSYPDQRFYDRRPMLRAAVADLPDGVARRRLDAFLDHVDRTPPMGLTVHFLNVCRGGRLLLLADHGHHAKEERRRARTRLADLYQAADHDTEDEPPDSLPVMLEYAALCADDWLLREHQDALERLHAALEAQGSPYASPVEAVRATLMPAVPPAAPPLPRVQRPVAIEERSAVRVPAVPAATPRRGHTARGVHGRRVRVDALAGAVTARAHRDLALAMFLHAEGVHAEAGQDEEQPALRS